MKLIYSYFIDFPLYLRDTLIFFICLFFTMSVLQLVFLILHKMVLERREKRFKLKKVMYFSSLTRNFVDPDHPIYAPVDDLETHAFIDVCVDIMSGVSRQNMTIIHKAVREFGIPAFLVRNYKKSSQWITHYQIVETLGFLKLPELARLFREIISQEIALLEKNRAQTEQKKQGWLSDVHNPTARHLHLISKALWALSHICNDTDFRNIISVLHTPGFMSGKFNEYIFCNIIEAYRRREQTGVLLDKIEELFADDTVSLLIKRDFIQSCGIAHFTQSHTLVANCTDMFLTSPEIKMACIRTLAQIGDTRLEELTCLYLEDSDWRVRTVAAKDAHLCSDGIIPALRKVLCDRSYYVRLNAVLSLARKGEAGKAVLRSCAGSKDTYEHDMALYALKQG